MLKMLQKLSRRDWGYVAVCLAFIATQVWLDMTMPEYMSKITILVETPGSQMPEVWKAGGMMQQHNRFYPSGSKLGNTKFCNGASNARVYTKAPMQASPWSHTNKKNHPLSPSGGGWFFAC